MGEVAAGVRTDREFPVEMLRSPTDQDRRRIETRIAQLVGNAVRRRSLMSGLFINLCVTAW